MCTDGDAGSGMVATLSVVPVVECWQLLATSEVGRIGLLVGDRPEVLPVNYILDGENLLFRTAAGTVLSHAASRVVAFEVDRTDHSTHDSWSVLVQGMATDITNAVDASSERMRRLSLVTWAPGARHHWFRIEPDKVTGRRLRFMPAAL